MRTEQDRAVLWRRIALAVWAAGTVAALCLGYQALFAPQFDQTAQVLPRMDTTEVIAAPTGHGYRFVSARNITWAQAQGAAAKEIWRGHHGYLATIDSAGELAFVVANVFGKNYSDVTYLGGRQTAPREWRWVTGPDGAMDGGKGRLFWSGGDEHGHVEPGLFANWQPHAWQHGGHWDARKVCCVTIYSYGFPRFSTSLGNGFWEEGVAGYLVEFGE
jgi:hypothetical protein